MGFEPSSEGPLDQPPAWHRKDAHLYFAFVSPCGSLCVSRQAGGTIRRGFGAVSLVWDARRLRRYRHGRGALIREFPLEGGLHGFLEETLGRQG